MISFPSIAPFTRRTGKFAFLGAMGLLLACGPGTLYQITLMPPPEVYEEGVIDPFAADHRPAEPGDPIVLYATLRAPDPAPTAVRPYTDERGREIRVGSARVELGRRDVSWEEARRISLLKANTDRYPIQVAEVSEFGVLERTRRERLGGIPVPAAASEVGRTFAAEVDARLDRASRRDVFVYVHGYRVAFDNPILVAAELWHFLGYEGVFTTFAWPAGRSRFGYFAATEAAQYSARFFREFLRYLSEETQAERIHVIAYSSGTRVVVSALNQLALLGRDREADRAFRRVRLGQVMLVGSDLERDLLDTLLLDGLAGVTERLTIYKSDRDRALRVSGLVFRGARAGQTVAGELPDPVRELLETEPRVTFINVANAMEATSGNGHAYFRRSPWVSSDILATLLYGLGPDERGLEWDPAAAAWVFPADYVERLRTRVLAPAGLGVGAPGG